MIHDATVEVTCDTNDCRDSVQVRLEYGFDNYSGTSGGYISDDAAIEETLAQDHEWIIEGGQHYCCEECKEAQ